MKSDMTSAERSAWIDSLSADDKLVLYTPAGYRSHIVVAAWVKLALTSMALGAGEQLKLLRGLDRLIDGRFTGQVLAVIEPARAGTSEMIAEAMKLDTDARFKMLEGWETFTIMLRLEPSWMEAIRLFNRSWAPV